VSCCHQGEVPLAPIRPAVSSAVIVVRRAGRGSQLRYGQVATTGDKAAPSGLHASALAVAKASKPGTVAVVRDVDGLVG